MRPVRQEAVHSLWSRLFCGPLKMHPVPQEPVFGTEYLFRTVEAYFEHRVPQKTPSVQKGGGSCTECPFRTVEACFLHRMPLMMRRVPQEAFLRTARIFRTIGGPLRYRMPTTQPPSHHSTPSTPVPNARHTETSCRRSGAWRTF